ncbi:hypothetical protein N9H03_01705 [Flavobacteriales bacterium]|nr:hypothetical protein [Flavobacteriales bacterium]
MKRIVLSESSYDFKYKSILSHLEDFHVVEGGFFKLIKILATRKSFYHIRYIKYRGKIITVLRYLIIALLAKLSGSKIIWSCHNIYEHNFSSKKYNDFIREFLAKISHKIVVFHKDLIAYLPDSSKHKVYIASFGNYREFIEQQTEQNKEFQKQHKNWLNQQNIKFPDLISISAAKNNNLNFFISKLADKYNFLVIAPKVPLNIISKKKNIFIYNSSFVKAEIKEILNHSPKLIGIIGHDNISVPTSIYMFASFGIPVVVLNVNPVNSMVKEFSIGEVIDENIHLDQLILRIQTNYSSYQENCIKFTRKMSWSNSADVHKEVFS